MSIHMIRYAVSADADSYLIDTYLPQWLVTHTAWETGDPNETPILKQPKQPEGEPYYFADWRFAWGDNSKSVLLSNLTAYTQSYAPWYRLGYHECYHDQSNPASCAWDDQREYGTVPENVPQFI